MKPRASTKPALYIIIGGVIILLLIGRFPFLSSDVDKLPDPVKSEVTDIQHIPYDAILGVNQSLSEFDNYFYVSDLSDSGSQIQAFIDYLEVRGGTGLIEYGDGEYIVKESDLPLIIDSPNLHIKGTNRTVIKAEPGSLKTSPWAKFTVLWIRASNVTIENLGVDPNGGRQFLNNNKDPDSKASGILVTASLDDLWTDSITRAPTLENVTILKCRITNALTTAISIIKVNGAVVNNNQILDIHAGLFRGNSRKGITFIWCNGFEASNNIVDLDTTHTTWYNYSNGIFAFIANNINGVNTACRNGLIQNNTVIGSQDSSIEVHGGTQAAGKYNIAHNIMIKDNFVWGRNIIISRGSQDIQVRNNIIKYEGGSHGAGTLSASGLDTYPGTILGNISFIGNYVFYESGKLRDAVLINSEGQQVRDIFVEENYIHSIGMYGIEKIGRGVNIDGGKGAYPNQINNIWIRNNIFDAVTSEGIYVSNTVAETNIEVTGNTFNQIGYPGKTVHGILVKSPCKIAINNNTFQNLIGRHTIGIELPSTVEAVVQYNEFTDMDIGILLISGYKSVTLEKNEYDQVDEEVITP